MKILEIVIPFSLITLALLTAVVSFKCVHKTIIERLHQTKEESFDKGFRLGCENAYNDLSDFYVWEECKLNGTKGCDYSEALFWNYKISKERGEK